MKRPLAFIAALLVLPVTTPVRAEPPAPEPLPLAEALRRAVEGNVDLRRERVSIAISQANVTAALGQFDFLLTGGLTFTRTTTPPIGGNDLAGGYNNTFDANLGIARPLETGGNVALNLRGSRVDTNTRILSCPAGEGCIYYTNNWNLSFTHPLLRNFGSEIAQANIRRARIQQDLAMLGRQTRAATVLRDIIATYWELAYSTQDLAIRQSAVDLAREQLRVTRAQIDVGRLSPVDSAAVERAINDRLQDVAIAEQNRLFRTLELRRLMGVPAGGPVAPFAATDLPTEVTLTPDLAMEVRRALEGNPQLKTLRAGLQVSDIDLAVARSLVSPRLDFTGQIGTAGRDTTFKDAFDGAASFSNLVATAGLTFQAPIQNRAARGALDSTRFTRERSELDVNVLELDIADAVVRRGTEIGTARKRLEYARAAVGFATKNLEAEQARFSVGRSTNNDVLLRQQELKVNELQVVRATVDLLIAEIALAALTGDVLDRYGVSLKGAP